MLKTVPTPPTLSARLAALAAACRERETTLAEFVKIGHDASDAHFLLLLLFALPFCQPLPMYGLSTPIGLLIAAIGRSIALGRPLSLPPRVAKARIPAKFVPALIAGAGKIVGRLERRLRARRAEFVIGKRIRFIHGCVIAAWGLLLALPLPIPFSNLLAALPLPLMAAALLEDDGVMMIWAYAASALCLIYWIAMPALVWIFGMQILR